MKLWKFISVIFDFLFVFIIGNVIGGILLLIFNNNFENNIFNICLAILSMLAFLIFIGQIKNKDSLGKKISKKIIKDEDKKIKISQIILLWILIGVISIVLDFIF